MTLAHRELEQVETDYFGTEVDLTEAEKLVAYKAFVNLAQYVLSACQAEFPRNEFSHAPAPWVSRQVSYEEPVVGTRRDRSQTSTLDVTVSLNQDSLKDELIIELNSSGAGKVRVMTYEASEGEGAVRRFSHQEADPKNAAQKRVTSDEARAEILNEEENYQLEVAMGYNDQPVDPEEIARLDRLVRSVFGLIVDK